MAHESGTTDSDDEQRTSRDELSLLDRRSYLRLGAAAAGAISLGAATTRTADAEEVQFDRTVNAVDDLGMDPTGQERIDDTLASAFEPGTLLQFPPGRYLLERDHRARGLQRFGMSGLGNQRDDVAFVTPKGEGQKDIEFVDSEDIVVENLAFQDSTTRALDVNGVGGVANYQFAVDGKLTHNTDRGTVDWGDEIDGQSASGTVGDGGTDAYDFTGELTALSITGGEARVVVDGEEVDPASVGSDTVEEETEPEREESTDTVGGSTGSALDAPIMGDYNYERAFRPHWGARLDVERMAERLDELGVSDYFFLIWHHETDWEDFKAFVPIAAEYGITVWPHLVPPSETPQSGHFNRYSEPYKTDYVTWAEEIGKVANEHENVVGWAMDDLTWSQAKYQPESGYDPVLSGEYVEKMTDAGKAVCEDLQFLATTYDRHFDEAFVEKYTPAIDGVMFAYPDDMDNIREKRALLPDETALLTTPAVLTEEHERRHPSPGTVENMTDEVQLCVDAVAEGLTDGVITYGLDKGADSTQGMFEPVADAYASFWENHSNDGGSDDPVAPPTDGDETDGLTLEITDATDVTDVEIRVPSGGSVSVDESTLSTGVSRTHQDDGGALARVAPGDTVEMTISDADSLQNLSVRRGSVILTLGGNVVSQSTVPPLSTASWDVEDAVPALPTSGGDDETDEENSGRGGEDDSDDPTTIDQTLDVVGEGLARYEFTVSGALQHNDERGTVDWGDEVDGATGSGTVGRNGTDAYDFGGHVTAFSAEGPVTVLLNGEEVDPESLGQNDENDDGERLPNTVTIVGYQQTPAHYSVTVDGSLDVNPDRGTHTAEDDVSGNVAQGAVGANGVDSYVYSGSITDLTLDVDAAVYVNGQQVDPRLVGQGRNPRLSNAIHVDGTGSTSVCDYEFTVSDGVAKAPELGSAEADDEISDGTVTGSVSGDVDAYRFSGRITSMRLSGSARVRFGSDN